MVFLSAEGRAPRGRVLSGMPAKKQEGFMTKFP